MSRSGQIGPSGYFKGGKPKKKTTAEKIKKGRHEKNRPHKFVDFVVSTFHFGQRLESAARFCVVACVVTLASLPLSLGITPCHDRPS